MTAGTKAATGRDARSFRIQAPCPAGTGGAAAPDHPRSQDVRPPRPRDRRGLNCYNPVMPAAVTSSDSRAFRWKALDWAVVGLPLAALYYRTMSRDLGTIDSGELAAAAARLGIAHPSGYPIYSLLARLAVAVFPGPPILAVNLLALLGALGGALALAALVRELWPPGEAPRWAPWAAGLWFGTDLVFWAQATGNEVYGLHMMFGAILLRQSLRLLRAEAGPRDLVLSAYALGIAMAHHLSAVFLLPAVGLAAVFYLDGLGLFRRTWTGDSRKGLAAGTTAAARAFTETRAGAIVGALLPAAGAALLAWSVVLYLPIRASRNPILDWGAPTTWARFWRHALAAQYHVWMFESGRMWIVNLRTFVLSLPARLSWPVVLLAMLGGAKLARTHDRKFAVLAVVLITTLIWASSYDIHDLGPYYLPVDLVLALFATAGAEVIAEALKARAPSLAVAGALVLAFSVWQGAAHFRDSDRSDDHFVRAHAETVLRSLPPKTILISRHWDALTSACLYLQEIEKLRTDVTVVDPELLRRSWYVPQLRRWDPGLFTPFEDKVTAFEKQIDLFEANRPYEAPVLEACYEAVLDGIAQSHRPERPTAFTPDVVATFLRDASPVPEGLVFLLRGDPAASPRLDPPDVDRLLKSGFDPEDPIHRQIIDSWVWMFGWRVRFLEQTGRKAEIPPWQSGLDRLKAVQKGTNSS